MKNSKHEFLLRIAWLLLVLTCFPPCSVLAQLPKKLPVIPRSIYDARPEASIPAADMVLFPFWPVDTTLIKTSGPLKATELTQNEISKVDSLLNIVRFTEGASAGHYFHQLISATDFQNHKLIYVNAFCRADDKEWWKTHLYQAKGGGACFYRVLINLTTNKYSAFGINAPK